MELLRLVLSKFHTRKLVLKPSEKAASTRSSRQIGETPRLRRPSILISATATWPHTKSESSNRRKVVLGTLPSVPHPLSFAYHRSTPARAHWAASRPPTISLTWSDALPRSPQPQGRRPPSWRQPSRDRDGCRRWCGKRRATPCRWKQDRIGQRRSVRVLLRRPGPLTLPHSRLETVLSHAQRQHPLPAACHRLVAFK